MTLRVRCPACDVRVRIEEEQEGRLVACPSCGERFHAPAPQAAEEASSKSAARAADHPLAVVTESTDDDEAMQPMSKSGFNIDHDELIDMTAMVDIVFFLLIFFLVTSMQALDSAIAMPKPDTKSDPEAGASSAASSEPSTLEQFEADDEYIVIHIDRNDRMEIDGIPLLDVPDFLRRIRELRAVPPHPSKLLVVGDGNATHGAMVDVLDAARDAGLDRVRTVVTGLNDE